MYLSKSFSFYFKLINDFGQERQHLLIGLFSCLHHITGGNGGIRLQAGGDNLPDAVQAVGWSNYDLGRYGRGGTFIDLTPYVTDPEIMPNLSAILEKYPNIKAAITQDNGGIYGLPQGTILSS